MTDTLRMASDRGIPADAAINDMLEAVGGFLGVSRAYVMLDEKDETRPSEQQPHMRRPPRAADAEPLTLRDAERRLISESLRRCRGNKQRAADQLGLTWAALDRRCKKLNIEIFKG